MEYWRRVLAAMKSRRNGYAHHDRAQAATGSGGSSQRNRIDVAGAAAVRTAVAGAVCVHGLVQYPLHGYFNLQDCNFTTLQLYA